MKAEARRIVLCAGLRTPIGHISRSLADLPPAALMHAAVHNLLERARLEAAAVDGLIVGWVGQTFSAPNIARVVALTSGLPEKCQSLTVQNNCISSFEAVSEAARRILVGEGRLYVVGGTESMSRLPYTIEGSRAARELRSLATVKERWGALWDNPNASIVDAMEEGLTDPVEHINMAATAEVCAQFYAIPREEQDRFACESFRRTLAAWSRGFYASHVAPVVVDGRTILEKDEYPFLREDLPNKPQMFAKAPALFGSTAYPLKDFYRDNAAFLKDRAFEEGKSQATVTLFNSCGRSDGASAVIVTTPERAAELGLQPLAELRGWGYYGNEPAFMGVSPALAAPVALESAGLKFAELDRVELHEPFAATVLSIFKIGPEHGCDWRAKYEAGAINPNGGSIALGHPLGATGTRLILNLMYSLHEDPAARLGLAAACAGGGTGGALVLEKLS
ncbi:MAG: thiolase family protein [Elusimicrobia bacterium]|nr:thiolase family protein [Elusimicrobiota bacterium]